MAKAKAIDYKVSGAKVPDTSTNLKLDHSKEYEIEVKYPEDYKSVKFMADGDKYKVSGEIAEILIEKGVAKLL